MMIPVDWARMEGRRYLGAEHTDVLCDVCNRPWGGLVYDEESDTFRHRDPKECALRTGTVMTKDLRSSLL